MRAVQFTDSAFNMPKLTSSLDQTFLTEEEAQTKFLTNTASAFTAPAALVANTATIASMAGSATQAGHSQTADSANQAGKLTNARTIKTDLGSVDAKGFDGTNDVLPGVTGTLPVAHGGTGQTTLALTRYALGLGNTTGTLEVAYGGTGITSNPSMLVNLGTTAAATVFQASPRPGVTGTLPVAYGGTGTTNLANITVGSASNANYATNAGYANSAAVATTSAHYATSAGTAGTCTGNAATATKATGDQNGSNISTTYLKSSVYAATVVSLTGAVKGSGTISGSKVTIAASRGEYSDISNNSTYGHDMDNVKAPGVYRLDFNDYAWVNQPKGAKGTTCYLEVVGNGSGRVFQHLWTFTGATHYYRGYTNNRWYDWYQMTTTVTETNNS